MISFFDSYSQSAPRNNAQDTKQQTINYAEILKSKYPDVNHHALIRASEFLSMGLSGSDILEQLGLPTADELDLTPEDLDEDFYRDIVVGHFQYRS